MNRLLLIFFLYISVFGTAQHQDKVDFSRGEIFIEPIPLEKRIKGTVVYKFDALQDVDSVFLDAKDMEFNTVTLNGRRVKYSNSSKTIVIHKKLKKGNVYELFLDYSCAPKQTVYFLGWDTSASLSTGASTSLSTAASTSLSARDSLAEHGRNQIWTQGQGKYTSHWLPSFDAMEEKVEFDLSIGFDKDYEVIANGKLVEIGEEGIHKIWKYDMQNPMSSYLLAFAIGKYDKRESNSTSGIPLENYYYPQDSSRAEPTYRYTKEIFDFLETEIGVPYPWQNYKQIPVRDFLYAGMENTGTTIFSDQYVIDSTAFVDKNYVNVNAHEMAHQWFGNLVTEKDGNHHWLHEGFATYYAYLAEKELFGNDHFYWKLFGTLEKLWEGVEKGEGQSLIDPKASSLTFYEKGAWALFMLRNEIGDAAFRTGIKSYLQKYQFKNVTVDDFLTEMEGASGQNLSGFRAEWLENKGLPYEKAIAVLVTASSSLKLWMEMQAELKNSRSNDIDYKRYWNVTNSIHLKKQLLEKYHEVLPEILYLKAFESDTVPLRQALLGLPTLAKNWPRERLESFLEDDSYVTMENALFLLWQNYPERRSQYLDRTKRVIGLPNKNVRLLWLTLAVLTENYGVPSEKQAFLNELMGYTLPHYAPEVRQGAFFYIDEVFAWKDQNLKDLLNATAHHSWQFRKFARNLLDKLLEEERLKKRVLILAETMEARERRYLENKLK